MNLNVSKEFFNEVKSNFMKLNQDSSLDPEIKDVVLRWQKSPLIDKIVPRWSCEGHSTEYRMTDYYIIFCTQEDGANILYNIFEKFNDRDSNFPAWKYSISMLVMNSYDDKKYPHIQIGRATCGEDESINIAKSKWLEILQEIEKQYE